MGVPGDDEETLFIGDQCHLRSRNVILAGADDSIGTERN